MIERAQIEPAGLAPSDAELGSKTALLIWDDTCGADDIRDPRTAEYANAVIDRLAAELAGASGVLKRMMRGASEGAKGLNVEPFQGLVEVIQNADDVGAHEVRFALRETGDRRQLLIVHNGLPVTALNVLPMALPYLTTKTHRVDQRGRFGIGLKTLSRIADSITIHSAPYHFSGDNHCLCSAAAEAPIANFYDPSTDTLLVLNMRSNFDEEALARWFDEWDDDSLIFLASVRRFRWCTILGETVSERAVESGTWSDCEYGLSHGVVVSIEQRRIHSGARAWTVWKADVVVPPGLHPANKQRSETTAISVAIQDVLSPGSLYIGFKTRVPFGLPLSIDAQFDPTTTREALLENDWNNWLIDRCADVLADVACGLLKASPRNAWSLVPLSAEYIGSETDRWLREQFSTAFARVRDEIADTACIIVEQRIVPLSALSYEARVFNGLLGASELGELFPTRCPLPIECRDLRGRWRDVLDQLHVSTTAKVADLLDGFTRGLFAKKSPPWWVEAAQRIIANHPKTDDLFGVAFWLSNDGRRIICSRKGETARPLVLAESISDFSERWNLVNRLHDAYSGCTAGDQVVSWLRGNAAFATSIDAASELAAFAERFAKEPVAITDEDLRVLRDRFDELPFQQASELGPLVGAAVLLDGFVYKGREPQQRKVSPAQAYLCRTLDSDHPNWPVAAGNLPEIEWISARYDSQLKTTATRNRRKREDGTIARGPRKFLMLLGAECTPRLELTGKAASGTAARMHDLRSANADHVSHDYTSNDMTRVLDAMQRLPKKERNVRSPALLRALSRNWERVYANRTMVPSEGVHRRKPVARGMVRAAWLNRLRETEWVAVGRGELVPPPSAVIKSADTQSLYKTSSFVTGIELADIDSGIASSLEFITAVRMSHLISLLETLRRSGEQISDAQVIQIYRTMAQFCPKSFAWNTRIDDMTVQSLRSQFSVGDGLIYVGDGLWRKPTELLRGKDIFQEPQRFVPSGIGCASLWSVLDVQEPSLDDCIAFCLALAGSALDARKEAALIDVYRHMEPLLPPTERRHRDRLKRFPIMCSERWEFNRPVYLVDSSELRDQLAKRLPGHRFWTPPCDTRELPRLAAAINITRSNPKLSVTDDQRGALVLGEQYRARFEQAIDLLSNELARNDPATREKLSIGWDQLRGIPLFIYDRPFVVQAADEVLGTASIEVALQALLTRNPTELHLCVDALPRRDYGGHAIASLFTPAARRKIDVEWVAAWQESLEIHAEPLRLASDEELADKLATHAGQINAGPKTKISVTPAASRSSGAQPRTLKDSIGSIAGAKVIAGSAPKPSKPRPSSGLRPTPPEPSRRHPKGSPATPLAYTVADLEQRGWEILAHALNESQDSQLVDFRNRRGVGADGVIEWKTFVEMKATGRGPQSSIEMSNAEFERAKERSTDFILALVSGLEAGEKCEVRLIIDPANRASIRPINGIRLTRLTEAPAIVIHFDEDGNA